jgi:hypothetical protein
MIETDPVAPLLEKVTPEVRPLVQELRALISEAMPQLTEKAYLGWGSIGYLAGDKMRDVVVAIAPQRRYANLGFADGVELPDPAQRLEGTGKHMRHVKIRSADDVSHPDVRALLQAAAARRGL